MTKRGGKAKFCFVGASHSRTIVQHLHILFSSLSEAFLHIDTKWPKDLINVCTVALAEGCVIVLIGIGQWAAGWPGGAPLSFEENEESMRNGLASFRKSVG